ncbi:hypothetical protein GUJ93_ZPchr0006g41403 [Zizania palustris]|uniref:Uncharacterized protein n=1 Tax=Zizania palustris TaxID=103762 RepID=A0A8J5W4V4_ZIZPA|nr:hypothetical protein GUJ93_ZPchr0006g41403 [Zizania palustris]
MDPSGLREATDPAGSGASSPPPPKELGPAVAWSGAAEAGRSQPALGLGGDVLPLLAFLAPCFLICAGCLNLALGRTQFGYVTVAYDVSLQIRVCE